MMPSSFREWNYKTITNGVGVRNVYDQPCMATNCSSIRAMDDYIRFFLFCYDANVHRCTS